MSQQLFRDAIHSSALSLVDEIPFKQNSETNNVHVATIANYAAYSFMKNTENFYGICLTKSARFFYNLKGLGHMMNTFLGGL